MLRFNSKVLASARLNGKAAKVARLNGRDVWTAGIRNLTETFTTLDLNLWRIASDPAASRAYPYVAGGLLHAGTPSALWSGKPAQSAYTREEADNATGTWTVKVGPSNGLAGLYSGVILGTDSSTGRMTEVVWDRNNIKFRYRTAATNSWVTLGSVSISLSAGDLMRVERYRRPGGYGVRVFQNGVARGAWTDSSLIPGEDNGRFIGVRLQGDKDLFSDLRSSSISEFIFAAGE